MTAKYIVALGLLGGALAQAAPERRIFSKAGGGYLVIEALRDDLLHFEVSGSGQAAQDQTLYTTPMVAKNDFEGPQSFTSTTTSVETLALRATVEADLCVTTFDKLRGVTLNRLCPTGLDQQWKTLIIDSPATRNVYGLGQYFSEESANGDWIGRVWDPLADGFGARLRGFAGGANDFSMFPIMYALGDGTQNYAMFVDVIYKQMWDFRSSPWKVGMWGDQLRWYVIAGSDLPSLRRHYMELTGHAPVPPKRSFGLWVSEFGFNNWDEIDSELASLRSHKFPVEGFALDLQWFGGSFGDPDHSRMGSLTWDEQAFPDPRAKIKKYRDDDGINLMLIEEPYISQTLGEHAALSSQGFLAKACATCGPTFLNYNPWWGRGGMVDYTNPAAGDFWHDYRRQDLSEMGVLDHWADLGEPEQYDSGSWYFGFPEIGKHNHVDIHNIYGFRWMESIKRGYERHQTSKRPFLLSRTGTSGIQRFGVALWSGDIGSGWGNLRSQMNAQMHMSLSGVDYYGSDVGGFQNNRDGALGNSELLYTQWFAAAAAFDVPVRPHAWNLDKRRPTAPSRRGDTHANLENLRQRYELTPYYYSLAHQAARSGDPVFPPLVHYYQTDARVRSVGDEKLIGKDLLVALAADAQAVSRPVYLPAGDWVDVRRGEWLQSDGATVDGYPLYDAGFFRLPLFARAGALIPTTPVDAATLNNRGKRADGVPDASLGIKVFADPTASSFTLYEDDGESNGQGVATTVLSQRLIGDTATVQIGPTQGRYAGMPEHRFYVVDLFVKNATAATVSLGATSLPECATRISQGPCFTNQSVGHVIVRTGELSVFDAKAIDVALAAALPAPPSLYLVCRNAAPPSGYSVYAVGSTAALGNWDAGKALKLVPAAPNTWVARAEGLPELSSIGWKCIQKSDSGSGAIVWQRGDNVRATTVATGFSGESVGGF